MARFSLIFSLFLLAQLGICFAPRSVFDRVCAIWEVPLSFAGELGSFGNAPLGLMLLFATMAAYALVGALGIWSIVRIYELSRNRRRRGAGHAQSTFVNRQSTMTAW